MRAILIPVEGRPKMVDLDATNMLAELQREVSGYIESVPLLHDQISGYINEEGKIHDLPPNVLATAIARLGRGDYIAGTMVVVGACDAQGEDTEVPDDLVETIYQIIPGGIEGWK